MVELFFKKLEAVVSVTFPEMNSSVDIFLRTFWRQKQLFLFCFKIDQNNFSYVLLLKEPFFCLQCVLFYISEWELHRNVLLGMFLPSFTFQAFPYSSFFCVTKNGHKNIFKSLVVPFSANRTKHHEKSFVFLQIIFEEWHWTL